MSARYPNKNSLYLVLFLALTILFYGGCRKEVPSSGDLNLTLYAAGYSQGLFKSDNGGVSWFPLNMDQSPLYSYFKKIYLDPFNPSLIYVTTTGAGLFVLDENKGRLKQSSGLTGSLVTTLALTTGDGENNLTYLAGLHDEGFYVTGDFHGEWTSRHRGLSFRRVNTILSRGDNLLLVGTDQDLFRWDPEGERWVAASAGIVNKNILSLEADPRGGFILAGAGVYKKKKGRLQMFKRFPSLYKSVDNGLSWQAADKGLPRDTLVHAIAVSGESGERVFIGTSEGVFFSRNSGQSWQKESDGLPRDARIFDLKIVRVPDGRDLVYAAGSRGIFMKVDGSNLPWQDRNYGLGTIVTGLVVRNESVRTK